MKLYFKLECSWQVRISVNNFYKILGAIKRVRYHCIRAFADIMIKIELTTSTQAEEDNPC